MKSNHRHILKHFLTNDPKIHAVMETMDFNKWTNPLAKTGKTNYFLALCREIIGQQLSGKAASTIYDRFQTLFGKRKITPESVLKLPDQRLRDVGMSWGKVKYVKDLAQKTLIKEIALNKLETLGDEVVISELTKVKGIGKWTAEMFLIFTLRRENVFSFGDLGLKKGITKVYGVKDPSEKQIKKIIAKWHPYKSFGSLALWQSLEK